MSDEEGGNHCPEKIEDIDDSMETELATTNTVAVIGTVSDEMSQTTNGSGSPLVPTISITSQVSSISEIRMEQTSEETTTTEASEQTSELPRNARIIHDFRLYFLEEYNTSVICLKDELSDLLSKVSLTEREEIDHEVFVYLHHSGSVFTNIYWKRSLKSDLIEYWNNNWFCWGFDMTDPNRHQELDQLFRNIFGRTVSSSYEESMFPMVIGLRGASAEEIMSYRCKHGFDILVRQDDSMNTNAESPSSLMSQLKTMESESQRILRLQQSFATLEENANIQSIIKRFSVQMLDDLIEEYSPAILPWLKQNSVPVNLKYDSPLELALVVEYLRSDQIRSVSIFNIRSTQVYNCYRYRICRNIRSLSIIIDSMDEGFPFNIDIPPQIRHFELHIDQLVSFEDVCRAAQSIPFSVDRLTLCFTELQCTHNEHDQLDEYTNNSIKTLGFDLRRTAFTRVNHPEENVMACFLQSVMNSLSMFRNAASLKFVLLQEQNMELLPLIEFWKRLIIRFQILTEIFIEVNEPIDENVNAMRANLKAELDQIRLLNLRITTSILHS